MQANCVCSWGFQGYIWKNSKEGWDDSHPYFTDGSIVLNSVTSNAVSELIYSNLKQGDTCIDGEKDVYHVRVTGNRFIRHVEPGVERVTWPIPVYYRSGLWNFGVAYNCLGSCVSEVAVKQWYDVGDYWPVITQARDFVLLKCDFKKNVARLMQVDYQVGDMVYEEKDPYKYQSCPHKIKFVDTPIKIKEFDEVPNVDWQSYISTIEDQHKKPWGVKTALVKEALSSLTANTNNIANLATIGTMAHGIMNAMDGKWSGVEKFAKLSNRLRHFNKKSVKAAWRNASSSWLSYRYAYLTTKSDVESMYNWIDSEFADHRPRRVARSSTSVDNGRMCMKLSVNDKKLADAQNLWKVLKVTGFAPDLYNLWDLVPYSFVADWFLPIGECLESISSRWMWNGYFDVNYATYSWQWDHQVTDAYLKSFNLTITSYERWVEPNLPQFEYFASNGKGTSSKTTQRRVCDGAALFIK